MGKIRKRARKYVIDLETSEGDERRVENVLWTSKVIYDGKKRVENAL
jgi:hypothetical protein